MIYQPARKINIPKELVNSPAPAGGMNHILIPDRLFCKNIIINLSQSDFAPEIPALLKQKPVKKKVVKNVWRLWLKDTPQDEEQAFKKDIEVDFNPELFIKDPSDIEKSLDILQQHFGILQIVYLQGLANSPRTFPEIGAQVFIEMMMRHQSSKDADRLPRARIELAFIRATRGDTGSKLAGTLCRGEYFETILRLCRAEQENEMEVPVVSNNLDSFFKRYIKPLVQDSTVLAERELIQTSKLLNRLLYSNIFGLKTLYKEALNKKTGLYDLECADK